MNDSLKLSDFYDFEKSIHADFFPKNPLGLLGDDLKKWLNTILDDLGIGEAPKIEGFVHPGANIEGRVYIAKGAKVEAGAYLIGPAYIGAGSEVRHAAYVRGNVYAEENCVIGHTTEVKGSCFFKGAKAGHFAYVGDSLLGKDVNLGAGTKLANLKLKKGTVSYKNPHNDKVEDSGLRKFGAILGDYVQTGCNAVLSPGSLLLPKTAVLPCTHFHGTLRRGWAK